MFKLQREQVIAMGAAGIVLLGCALGMALSIKERTSALHELADRQETLSRLQVQERQRSDAQGWSVSGTAPVAAFLNAPTPGLAGAQLQAYFAGIATEQQAALISSAVEPATRDEALASIRMQATLELGIKSLQAMLHQLESGTPYVFVEAFKVHPSTTTQGGAEDPVLRLSLDVRALWRRGQP